MTSDLPAARILVVDDEPALVKSLCDTLGAEGYETIGCNSGQAALDALGSTHFDLLLTDLMMPGMDGIALCQAAQKFDPNLVSILMTGGGSIASAVKAMKAGALDYITKPLELNVVLAVLSRSLDVRRLRMDNEELARCVAKWTADLEATNQALRTSEEQLRTLANWAVQAQEDERAGLALTLHDHITQLLCAIQLRTHTLLNQLPLSGAAAKREAARLREMVGNAAVEMERISRDLRPSVLGELGLGVVLRTTTKEFAERTGVPVKLSCVPLPTRLPADTKLKSPTTINPPKTMTAEQKAMLASTPGRILEKEFLKEYGISQAELSRRTGVPRSTVNEIIKGKRPIQAQVAYALGLFFGMDPLFWINLQNRHDMRRVEFCNAREIRSRVQ